MPDNHDFFLFNLLVGDIQLVWPGQLLSWTYISTCVQNPLSHILSCDLESSMFWIHKCVMGSIVFQEREVQYKAHDARTCYNVRTTFINVSILGTVPSLN